MLAWVVEALDEDDKLTAPDQLKLLHRWTGLRREELLGRIDRPSLREWVKAWKAWFARHQSQLVWDEETGIYHRREGKNVQ
jgi:hypothetical protein